MSSTAGAIRAGRAFVEIFTKTQGLMSGLKAAERALKSFDRFVKSVGRGMMKLGVGLAAPFLLAARAMSGMFDDLPETQAMQAAWGQFTSMLQAVLVPVLQQVLPLVTQMIQRATEWVGENAGLVQSLAKIGAVLGVAGGALAVLGAALPLLLSPLGLLTGALVGGAAAWLHFSDTGQEGWNGIVEAIQAGNIAGAIDVGIATAKKAWSDFGLFVLNTWEILVSNLSKYWAQFTGWLKESLARMQGTTADWLIDIQAAMGLLGGLSAEEVKQTRREDTARNVAGIREETQLRLNGIEEARERMQAGIDGARDEAAAEFQHVLGEVRRVNRELPTFTPPRIDTTTAAAQGGGYSAQGTFNPFAVGGLSSSLEKQQVDELKRHTKLLTDIKKKESGGAKIT